ncbi:MAG: hypothetical protein WCI47_00845 [bacterium]
METLPKISYEDQLREIATAALGLIARDEFYFPHLRRGQSFSRDRNIKSITTSLSSVESGTVRIGLEFFRQAHESWAVTQQFITPNDQIEFWDVWCEWALLVAGPNSQLASLRDEPHYEDSFVRLPDEMRHWLEALTPRQPFNYEQLDLVVTALNRLERLISEADDAAAESELSVLRQHTLFAECFARLPHEMQEWLDEHSPRRAANDEQRQACILALDTLEDMIADAEERADYEAALAAAADPALIDAFDIDDVDDELVSV